MLFFVAWWAMWFSLGHTLLIDEPDYNGIAPSAVHQQYVAAKALSPAPLTVNFFTCRHAGPYRDSVDVLSADDYPFYAHTSSRAGLREWDAVVRGCVRLTQEWGLAPPIMVAQGFGRLHDGTYGVWRCPTAQEHRRLITDALRLGAAGVLFWRPPHNARYYCP